MSRARTRSASLAGIPAADFEGVPGNHTGVGARTHIRVTAQPSKHPVLLCG
jgi:hypothetical protein